MKNTLLSSVSTAAVLFCFAPAVHAQSLPGAAGGDWYVSMFAGAGALSDVETDFGSVVAVSFKNGFVLGGAVGKRINQNWRVEAELSYASYKADDHTYNGIPSGPVDGDLNAVYLLANAWYDIPTSGNFSPYVGGGIGAARVNGDTFFDGNAYGYGPGETKLAYQIGAGVTIPLGSNKSLDVGYRYKAVNGIDFDDNDGSGVYEDGDVASHSLQVGLNISF